MDETIKLSVGKEYDLITSLKIPGYGVLNNCLIKGFYLGKKPVETPFWQEPEKPEGNIFVSYENDQLKIYNTNSLVEKGEWNCDGSDDPTYYVGMRVTDVTKKAKLSPMEKEFLINQINTWNNKN